jgi:hypothetical protein
VPGLPQQEPTAQSEELAHVSPRRDPPAHVPFTQLFDWQSVDDWHALPFGVPVCGSHLSTEHRPERHSLAFEHEPPLALRGSHASTSSPAALASTRHVPLLQLLPASSPHVGKQ